MLFVPPAIQKRTANFCAGCADSVSQLAFNEAFHHGTSRRTSSGISKSFCRNVARAAVLKLLPGSSSNMRLGAQHNTATHSKRNLSTKRQYTQSELFSIMVSLKTFQSDDFKWCNDDKYPYEVQSWMFKYSTQWFWGLDSSFACPFISLS